MNGNAGKNCADRAAGKAAVFKSASPHGNVRGRCALSPVRLRICRYCSFSHVSEIAVFYENVSGLDNETAGIVVKGGAARNVYLGKAGDIHKAKPLGIFGKGVVKAKPCLPFFLVHRNRLCNGVGVKHLQCCKIRKLHFVPNVGIVYDLSVNSRWGTVADKTLVFANHLSDLLIISVNI